LFEGLYAALVILPITGAAIGYVTNWLAVKLLFRPYRPVRVLGFTLQGLLPRRRKDMARRIGEVVEEELLSAGDVMQLLASPAMRAEAAAAIERAIEARANEAIGRFLPGRIGRTVTSYLVGRMGRETAAVIDDTLENFGHTARMKLNLGRLVQEKLEALSMPELERMVLSLAAREIRHIVLMGALLGFLVGLLQALLLAALRALP